MSVSISITHRLSWNLEMSKQYISLFFFLTSPSISILVHFPTWTRQTEEKYMLFYSIYIYIFFNISNIFILIDFYLNKWINKDIVFFFMAE